MKVSTVLTRLAAAAVLVLAFLVATVATANAAVSGPCSEPPAGDAQAQVCVDYVPPNGPHNGDCVDCIRAALLPAGLNITLILQQCGASGCGTIAASHNIFTSWKTPSPGHWYIAQASWNDVSGQRFIRSSPPLSIPCPC